MALSGCVGRAPYCSRIDLTATRQRCVTERAGPRCVRFAEMAPTTQTTRAPGEPAALESQTATAYRRAAAQRCWVCNAPDSEPVRLQRRAGVRWVSEATVQLCTACLTALRTPRLVRQLDLGHATAAPPARPAPADVVPGVHPTPVGAEAPTEPPPLTLLKGA